MSTTIEPDKSILKKQRLSLKAQIQRELKRGLSAHQLALAFALGGTIGIMPVIWGTSLICVLIAWLLRLNQVVVQCANYLVYPLHIALFIPWLMGGDYIGGTNLINEDKAQLVTLLKTSPALFFTDFWQVNIQALLLWLLISPLPFLIYYCISRVLANRFERKKASRS